MIAILVIPLKTLPDSENPARPSASLHSNSSPEKRGRLMQGFGALLIIWGILDYIMGESGTDVYYDWFGIYLPDSIYNYSHWISMAIGTFLIGAGRASASSNSSSVSTPNSTTGNSGSSTTNSALAGGAAGAVAGMSAAQMAALKRAQESAQKYAEEQKVEEEEPEFDAGDMDF